MTTTTAQLWESHNGSVCCEKHLGMSSTYELQANPKAKKLVTGPDVWTRMTKADMADWMSFMAEMDVTEPCESCRGGW